ncbi:50S ribosomal protein L11 methyltransferase [Francisella sp. Scap27]|uniref:50S ribosomal protein L11 methyltransferase n=1 Tax=Francisella sp. Scap27 TaxID=2589986 RepID=UPI0015BEEEB0|nr:50S ribosomal protein L11 methyltransferase [Francisella sp. Scap27]QLE78364.1 50S ribosomal protein L11 methyltransferase [Francisella sp. Scap27]
MQKWHQIEFIVDNKQLETIEEYLFENSAGSITNTEHSDNESKLTVLYEFKYDIEQILKNLTKDISTVTQDQINYEIIEDQQWEAAWLYDYEPIEIGKNIVVYPNWREPPTDTLKTYIIVDPSIAFGCGNHETTKMCLEWLEENVSKNTTVLDYGCGTGVLAIGAIKLGAKYAEGIDIDPNSIESSQKNALENNVADKTHFSDNSPTQKFDLVVANIFSNILISLVENIAGSLKQGGKLALSGIIENQVDEVQEVFKEHDVVFSKPKQMGQWFMIDGVKKT